jgi:hypothetical protein
MEDLDRAPSFSFPLPPLPPEVRAGWPSSKVGQAEEDALFKTPHDLICPITHEVFRDPVINAAGQVCRAASLLLKRAAAGTAVARHCAVVAVRRRGCAEGRARTLPAQVYERAAIERHLSRGKGAAIDPLSRQPLPSPELTPVYILRSRAAEFREHTAQRNLERACQPGCVDPVRPPPATAARNLRGLLRTPAVTGLPVGVSDALRQQPPVFQMTRAARHAKELAALSVFKPDLRHTARSCRRPRAAIGACRACRAPTRSAKCRARARRCGTCGARWSWRATWRWPGCRASAPPTSPRTPATPTTAPRCACLRAGCSPPGGATARPPSTAASCRRARGAVAAGLGCQG